MIKNRLLNHLASGQFVVAPGIQDMITAVIANKVGFEFVYSSGYWSSASAFGLPDAGLTTYSQFIERIRILRKTSNAEIIADADTGFGGLLNVHHTVKGYAEEGVCAIQLEDQTYPKKCGHTPNTKVVPIAEMINKIKVAVEAREGSDMAIIARTDARASEGFERAIERAQAYGEAGADLIFVEALRSEVEMKTACRRVNKPMIANMATGGKSPIYSIEKLQELGFAAAIFPALTSLAAAAAIEKVLRSLKENGVSEPEGADIFEFSTFCDLIGFPEVWEFEAKWSNKNV